jgi:hypothetical protein
METPLLATKLFVPAPRPQVVLRARLLEHLTLVRLLLARSRRDEEVAAAQGPGRTYRSATVPSLGGAATVPEGRWTERDG